MSRVLARYQMDQVTLTDIFNRCRNDYYSLWRQAQNLGRDVKVYLHWSAGHYGQFWDDYHIQIDEDGSLWIPKGLDFSDSVPATWLRNTGAVNISCLCCAFGNTEDLGDEAPTALQLESLYMTVAVVCTALDLSIDIYRVMTHGEAADNEDGYYGAYDEEDEYGPKADCERWDLEYLQTDESPEYDPWNEETRGGTIIRGKAAWYNNYYDKKVH